MTATHTTRVDLITGRTLSTSAGRSVITPTGNRRGQMRKTFAPPKEADSHTSQTMTKIASSLPTTYSGQDRMRTADGLESHARTQRCGAYKDTSFAFRCGLTKLTLPPSCSFSGCGMPMALTYPTASGPCQVQTVSNRQTDASRTSVCCCTVKPTGPLLPQIGW
jgi:hypothetical protein